MWTIFKVFIEFVTILLLFCFASWPRGTWDLSSLTRGGTCTPCIGRRSLNHWTTREVPHTSSLIQETEWGGGGGLCYLMKRSPSSGYKSNCVHIPQRCFRMKLGIQIYTDWCRAGTRVKCMRQLLLVQNLRECQKTQASRQIIF